MSFNGLSIVGSALGAFQAAENVISNDITNVNTPGASKQTPVLSQSQPISGQPGLGTQVIPGTIGQGVALKQIQRIHDTALDTLYRGAYSSQNYYTQLSAGFTTLQQSFDEPSGGISNALGSFQAAVGQLASINTNSSNATANRTNVLQSAISLTTALNHAGNQVGILSSNTLTMAKDAVTTVNGILDQIATLNGEIRAGTAAGESPNTYLDQRDHLVDQLSQYVPTTTVNELNGSTLITVNGFAVVNDVNAYHLETPIVVIGANAQSQIVVGMAADPNPANPTPVPLGSGILGGLVSFYNGKLVSYTSSLNGVASAVAQQFNNINASGYDQNAQQGSKLFTTVSGAAIQASNIIVAMNSPSQIAMASASTAAGSLTKSMNTSTTSVTTSTLIDANTAFNNSAPAAGVNGTIKLNVNGVTSTLIYNTATTDTTLSAFMSRFNALGAGVTASFDSNSQKVIFARDPSNESLAYQATGGYLPTASFELTDTSNGGIGTQPASGVTASGLLQVLGAGGLSSDGLNIPPSAGGVSIVQGTTNAFSASDNSNAGQLQKIFTSYVGVPPVSTTVTTAIASGSQIVTPIGGLGSIIAGTILTIGAGTANQENVTVSSVSALGSPPTFTATFANVHALVGGRVTVQAAQTQTISSYYGNFISTVGFDASAANSGLSVQTNLALDIEKRRQGVDGINLDEETQKLLQYQMAYQAVAKTYSVLESLLSNTISQLIP